MCVVKLLKRRICSFNSSFTFANEAILYLGDANRQISEYKFKLSKSEQDITTLEQNVSTFCYFLTARIHPGLESILRRMETSIPVIYLMLNEFKILVVYAITY